MRTNDYQNQSKNGKPKICDAVVGLGWIAQEIVLPAKANDNSELVRFCLR
jgi:hypothetical protein